MKTQSSSGDEIKQSLVSLLAETVTSLHVQQSVNKAQLENPANQYMYFQIPLQIGEQMKTGELLVINEREWKDNKWESMGSFYRFYLETQTMGPVDISIQAIEKQLTVHFSVNDPMQAELINQHTSTLRRILNDHGYGVLHISCEVSQVVPLSLAYRDYLFRQRLDITV